MSKEIETNSIEALNESSDELIDEPAVDDENFEQQTDEEYYVEDEEDIGDLMLIEPENPLIDEYYDDIKDVIKKFKNTLITRLNISKIKNLLNDIDMKYKDVPYKFKIDDFEKFIRDHLTCCFDMKTTPDVILFNFYSQENILSNDTCTDVLRYIINETAPYYLTVLGYDIFTYINICTESFYNACQRYACKFVSIHEIVENEVFELERKIVLEIFDEFKKYIHYDAICNSPFKSTISTKSLKEKSDYMITNFLNVFIGNNPGHPSLSLFSFELEKFKKLIREYGFSNKCKILSIMFSETDTKHSRTQ